MDEAKRASQLQEARYANYFEVVFSEVEFVVGFGQQYEESDGPTVHTRIVMSPQYLLMLLDTLRTSVDQFQAEHGAIARLRSRT